MRNIFYDYASDLRARHRVTLAVQKGHAARAIREVEPRDPATWEFSGFSQNGEDGIIDVLLGTLRSPQRNFLEIGAADGVQNNSSWLVVTRQFHGLAVEGDPALSAAAHRVLSDCCIGVEFRNSFVNVENAGNLVSPELRTPGLLSLDIGGNDFHVAKALLQAGLRPKIAVVEFNSVFGPQRSVTIPYTPAF